MTSTHSELRYMYCVNLGLNTAYSPTSEVQPDYGTGAGFGDIGLVKNLHNAAYWSDTADEAIPGYAWFFSTHIGIQHGGEQVSSVSVSAWAVRPGDVATVPEPETYDILLAGLGLLGFKVRRGKQKSA